MTETVSGSLNRAPRAGDDRVRDDRDRGARLRVERIHTTAGVHPYDEVTWERRDVVMTNWRDGSVNFEQRGVEFPDFWSPNAVNIVTTKYFRGALGTPTREWSLKQLVDRVVATYVAAGRAHAYLATDEDAEVFEHELAYALIHQVFSFNSPVWFNVGTQSKAQVSACFILAVDDSMDSILDWYKEEGLIFKGGSGAGVNLSRIRSSKELLSSGGTASGPVSFMRGADASAGTIKSGGATRRAAKMVILDVDHPDIEEFIETKAREEDKIRALRDAGFDMDLGGRDIVSVQYQNANNSVRVSDEFMRAVEEGKQFSLYARRDGSVISTLDARSLFRTMAQAAWECADPGIQYDDTINDWHTCPETGRITASNPCFPGDQRVVTDKGLIRIGDLVRRAAAGEDFAVYTHDATADDPAERVIATRPTCYMVTGTNEILELRFSDRSRLRCTPNHRLWTRNRRWVRADELTEHDRVLRSHQYAPRVRSSWGMPERARLAADRARLRKQTDLPEKWDEEFAHYLGWLVGDGCLTDATAVTVYGSAGDRTAVLPHHHVLLERVTGFQRKPSVPANGTRQLRVGRAAFAAFLRALGVSSARSPGKRVPEALFEAPDEIVRAFLRGLFDADGTVVNNRHNETRYVGLGSRSEELLLDVQELLASCGIAARIYEQKARGGKFRYTREDGTEVVYGKDGFSYDLRISSRAIHLFAQRVGFTVPQKRDRLAAVVASGFEVYATDESVRLLTRKSVGFETTYNLTEPRNHSYIVGGTAVANCSEYLHLDNSSCNLASLNLMKFLRDDDTFDAARFAKVVELVITAMDISICFADFPTEKIAVTTRAFRQLGIGYANLGALLMATGHAYDSDGGRAVAAAITSLMTGTAYQRSAELAAVVGPYDGYARNAEAHKRVIRKHAAANDTVRSVGADDLDILRTATQAWRDAVALGERFGYRNAQASVLAPTGCLTADTLVTTDRGLARLGELGDAHGERWQDVDVTVSTDEGPRPATRFFVNGEEPIRRIVTTGGYAISGTLAHRVKVVEPKTGEWAWKRLVDVTPGDLVPVQLGTLVGEPRRVPLPELERVADALDRHLIVPDVVDAELAEFVGHFMGSGSLHARGLRLCTSDKDLDVTARLRVLAKQLFHIEPVVTWGNGCQEVILSSARLAQWWRNAGLAKPSDDADEHEDGVPRIPSPILETNDPAVYAAFARGVFESAGTVLAGLPTVSTAFGRFAEELRTLLLTLGLPTTTRETASGGSGRQFQVRIRNSRHARAFLDRVGFLSARRSAAVTQEPLRRFADRDSVHLPTYVWLELAPVGSELREPVRRAVARRNGVSRDLATRLFERTADARLGHALGYLFEKVTANEDGGLQPTFDLSVPDNVTYVAGGFVSHNTIGLMMDCDTTGIEPDLALVKTKKLVGGASMQIVNGTVPRALAKLGYQQEQIEAIVDYVKEHGHVVDAPGLRPEHYEVFDCAMGERAISPIGHVRMMAATQPFISGAISKSVNMPESATVEDVEAIYFQGWKLGLKALAIYRDNCKVGQPLSDARAKKVSEPEVVVEYKPVRKRLPKKRPSETVSFTVGGAEGYLTAGSYPDDGLGELFIKMSKQGSTLAGTMDAFSIAVSIGLQYGVPLEAFVSKFVNMRFEPAGMTDDPDVRMAQSVMDYIFRRLALDFLPHETRAAYGIFTAQERAAAVSSGSYAGGNAEEDLDVEALRSSAPIEKPHPAAEPATAAAGGAPAQEPPTSQTAVDAPLCFTCGVTMRPAGSCYVCEQCGATSGCS